MYSSNIGTQLPAFLLRNGAAAARIDSNRYNKEISSGFVSDVAEKLDGNLAVLSHIDDRKSSIGSYKKNLSEAKFFLQQQDLVLDFSETEISRLKHEFINTSYELDTKVFDSLGNVANETLSAVLGRLNQSARGRSLFAGLVSNEPALVTAQKLTEKISEITQGYNDVNEIQSVISDWFSGRGKFSENDGDSFSNHGNFDSFAYLGNLERNTEIIISEDHSLELSVKASDPDLRSAIEALVTVARLSGSETGNAPIDRQTILEISAQRLHVAEEYITRARARVGSDQEYAENVQATYDSEEIILDQTRNNILRVDIYETFLALEEARTQLQTTYYLTTRLAQLSLEEYLR